MMMMNYDMLINCVDITSVYVDSKAVLTQTQLLLYYNLYFSISVRANQCLCAGSI